MLVAKQVADIITFSRGILAFILAGLGLLVGKEALPMAAGVMIADWAGDMLDGPIARRSRVYYHSWIGDHDLEVDMTVSVGLLIYMLGRLHQLVGGSNLPAGLGDFLPALWAHLRAGDALPGAHVFVVHIDHRAGCEGLGAADHPAHPDGGDHHLAQVPKGGRAGLPGRHAQGIRTAAKRQITLISLAGAIVPRKKR
jgi:hypothetical protein